MAEDKTLGEVHYQESKARSILNPVKAMMPLNWTINPYRGCRHACVYCFARPSHTYFGLNAGEDFHSQIFVKVNAPELLRKEFSRPSWKKEAVCLGSATDPYQPIERKYRLSRQIIEIFCEVKNPLEIITKSPLIVDDVDLLMELNRLTGGKVSVNMSITTLNAEKARLIEPGTPSPQKRLAALGALNAMGIKTRLFIMPVLPGITDAPEELEELFDEATKIGVKMISTDTLRIARGLEEYYHSFIAQNFPELRPRYQRLYENGRRTFASDRYREALKRKTEELRLKYNLLPSKRAETDEKVFDEPQKLQTALTAAENQLTQTVMNLEV